jgi:hypothetical protein
VRETEKERAFLDQNQALKFGQYFHRFQKERMRGQSSIARLCFLLMIASPVSCLIQTALVRPSLRLPHASQCIITNHPGFLSPGRGSLRTWPTTTRRRLVTQVVATAGAAGSLGRSISVAKASAVSGVVAGSLQLAVSKFMGYGILVGSLFLQMPQIIKIVMSRSVMGISRASR